MLIIATVLCFVIPNIGNKYNNPTITDLNNPAKFFDKYYNAYNPWDMAVEDDGLYIGGGDYGENTGPTTIWRYDIGDKKWNDFTTVEDEAVTKFMRVDGELYSTGTDPTTPSWKYGNYHRLVGKKWETNEALPNAVHNYDIVRFDGRTFFAIGTESGDISPVKVTVDGINYEDVPFFIGDTDIKDCDYDFLRVYDIYVLNGEMYCLLRGSGVSTLWMFFKYNGVRFEYLSFVSDHGFEYTRFWPDTFGPKVIFDDACYLTTGKLYRTTDFKESEKIDTPDGGLVTDIMIEKDGLFKREKMYVLSTALKENGDYKSTVWQYTKSGKFKEVLTVDTQTTALSFAKYEDIFFVALGGQDNTHAAVGTVLMIEKN